MTEKQRVSTPSSGSGLYDQVQRMLRPGAVHEAQYGHAGVTFPGPAETRLALFQLTEPMRFPGEGDDEPDVPRSSNAKMIWLLSDDTYGGLDYSAPQTVYHPTAMRNQGKPVGLPPLVAGQRCYAWFNRQSGRWEAIVGPLLWRRFEMTAGLACGQSAAAVAFTYDGDGQKVTGAAPAETITVYDATSSFSKIITAAGDPGALGVALFWPDRGRWEIVWMQTPGDFWGTLEGHLNPWDVTQTVRLTTDGLLGGYNVFGPNHGPTITAHNPPGGGNEAARVFSGRQGDKVLCRWDIRNGLYVLVLVEANDHQWPSIDVVTRTSLSINFAAQTYSHKYYTRQIQLPPWTTIGPEVEH